MTQNFSTDELIAGLGGKHNVLSIEGCITRLRTIVADAQRVDETALKAAGAMAVIHIGELVQVVVGPSADSLAAEIRAAL